MSLRPHKWAAILRSPGWGGNVTSTDQIFNGKFQVQLFEFKKAIIMNIKAAFNKQNLKSQKQTMHVFFQCYSKRASLLTKNN